MRTLHDWKGPLATYLRGLGEKQLVELLTYRVDARIEPAPRTVSALADALLYPGSIMAALAGLTLPQVQVAQAAAALGDGCTRRRLAALLGVGEDDQELTAALGRLTAYALVWPAGEGLVADHLHVVWPHPLGLGATVHELLEEQKLAQLRLFAKTLGLAGAGAKPQLVGTLTGWLGEPENVRDVLASAPAETRRRLEEMAWEQPEPYGVYFGRVPASLSWAAERGLVLPSGWGRAEQMPREVALALRGGDFRAPFDPRPPALSGTPVAVENAERESAAAAAALLAAVTAAAEATRGKPLALLRTGGLGVRELRRLAKSAGLGEERARLIIELITAGGQTTADGTELALAEDHDRYAAAEPADQLLELVGDWLEMPACPLAPPRPGEPAEPALYWNEQEEQVLTAVRAALLELLTTTLPEGTAVAPGTVVDHLRWHRPVLSDLAGDDLERFVTGIWREAHELGLLALGTPTELCRRLFTGDARDAGAVRAHAKAITPELRATALFQADLTAVVTGTPEPGLLALLDGAADPESRSGAWTWRFSPASVRRALDCGTDPGELRDRLTAAATGGQLSQPLSYLIDDVARRHGHVRVHPVGCCLTSDDDALLAEVLASRPLRALKLRRLAPTVLASAKPPAETLAALRTAGYAPIGTREDGTPDLKLAPRPRTAPPPPADVEPGLTEPGDRLADPAELARRLRR